MSVKSNLKALIRKELKRLAAERLGFVTDDTWAASCKFLEAEYYRMYKEWFDRDAEDISVMTLERALAIAKKLAWNREKEGDGK